MAAAPRTRYVVSGRCGSVSLVVGERIAGWTGQIGPVAVRGEEDVRIVRTARKRAFEACILDPVVRVSQFNKLVHRFQWWSGDS